jgi:preprotein translocase subunit SecD
MSFLDYVKDFRILAVLVVVLLLLAADATKGLHLGMDFIGGTQIPITFEHSINPVTFTSLQSTLQQRLSKFGLSNPTIQGIGDGGSYIGAYIQIPNVSSSYVNSTIQIIEKEGVFQEIVNGREVLNGSALLGGNSGLQPSYQVSGNNVSWQVNFYITQTAAKSFAEKVYGQANKPAYMFLDRPTNSIMLIGTTLLGTSATGTTQDKIAAMQSATQLGNQTIPVEILAQNSSNWPTLYIFFKRESGSYKNVILSSETPAFIKENLTKLNYSLDYNSNENMTPVFINIGNVSQALIVESWPSIGLLDAPTLSGAITTGTINEGYVITGQAPSNLGSLNQKIAYAQNQSQGIVSVLSGGALPVQVIVGVPTTLPPTLGKHFEIISAVALLLATIAVSITIVIRYRRLFLIAPILLTTLAELFIITSVIGLIGSIDLAAVAGMIAVVGTGVDAQIIITDEILVGSRESSVKTKLNHAFYIVWADAILVIIAMLPLAFSTSLTNVIGFAYSTMLGAMLGALLTRPAYGAIVSRHLSAGEHHNA